MQNPAMDWRRNLIESDDDIVEVLASARRIAVLGIKPQERARKPAFYVPRYLQQAGYEIVPVPVYYPDCREILGRPVFRSVADIPQPVDLVVVFRRSEDLPPHVNDLLAAKPPAVWFQSGIRNDAVAERLARAGIRVVQDRCSMVEHYRVRRP